MAETTASPRNLNEYLDLCFKPLGFVETKALAGRNYLATVEGRQIKVHCSMRRRTKYISENIRYRQYAGHRLEINIDTNLKTRLAIATRVRGILGIIVSRTNRWFGSVKIWNADPFYYKFDVWAADAEWSRLFLSDGRVLRQMRELFPDDLPPNIGIKFFPGKLSFSQRTALQNITPEKTRQWLNALFYLANFAESAPPQKISELTWFEKKSEENPLAVSLALAFVLLGVPVLLLFFLMIFILILIVLFAY